MLAAAATRAGTVTCPARLGMSYQVHSRGGQVAAMSCRSTPGNTAITTWTTALIKKTDPTPGRTTEEAFHRLKREGKAAGAPDPSPEQVAQFIDNQEAKVRGSDFSDARKEAALGRWAAARDAQEVPDGATFHAWSNLEGEALRGDIRPTPGGGGARTDVREQVEQLQRMHQEMLDNPDKMRQYLTNRSNFRRYSHNNTMLIMMQRPDATMVASESAWKKMGRTLNPGEKERGIEVLVPMVGRYTPRAEANETPAPDDAGVTAGGGDSGDGPANDAASQQKPRTYRRFGVGKVYDVSQTSGAPVPTDPMTMTEDPPQAMEDHLRSVADKHGVKVNERNLSVPNQPTLYGFYDRSNDAVTLNSATTAGDRVTTFAHELAHRFDPAIGGDGNMTPTEQAEAYRHGRGDAEAVAEASSFVVAQRFGYDTSNQSVSYISAWCGNNPKKLGKLLDRIDKVCGQLLPESATDSALTAATKAAAKDREQAAKTRTRASA